MENNNNQEQYNDIPAKVVKIETEVDNMKDDIVSIKDDVKDLKEKQTDQTIHLNQTNNLLGKHIAMMNLTLKQNSEIISANTEMLRDFKNETDNKINDINNKINNGSNTNDSFKQFLIEIGKKCIQISISGGIIFAVLELITKGKFLNLFM